MEDYFDKSDSGGYRISPHRETIIKSLSETKYQSLRHLSVNTGLSADDIEPVVETDEEIRFQLVGQITVYFLLANQPNGKLYNSGNNSFLIKKSDSEIFTPKRSKVAPRPKQTGVQTRLDLEKIEECGRLGKTVAEMAEILNVPLSSMRFYTYSKLYPQYGEAYKRGKSQKKRLTSAIELN